MNNSSCPGDDLEEGELDEESQQGGQPSVTSEPSVVISAPIPTLTSTTAAVAVSQHHQSHSHSQSQSSSTSAATSIGMGQTSREERSTEEEQQQSQPSLAQASGSGAGAKDIEQATAAPAKIQPIVWESSSSSSECGAALLVLCVL